VPRSGLRASGNAMIDALRKYLGDALEARGAPLVVAIDGRSGAGKSTIAVQLATVIAATVIPTDDFFAAELTAADWEARSPRERARDAIDWRRLRRLVLEPLRAGQPVIWHPFDFGAGERADGSYAISSESVRREPAPVIILDGAYSSRPELADLVGCAILVESPAATRRARLALREAPEFLDAWHERWDAAEDYYFSAIRPPESFDIVVNSTESHVSMRERHA
jgi:uridine kinase